MNHSERRIQAALMRRTLLRLHHDIAVPNSRDILGYEADLVTVTKTRFVHEFEIKTTMADYTRDFSKKLGKFRWSGKHRFLQGEGPNYASNYFHRPNYFWFVTYGFDIVPPDYAGHIMVTDVSGRMSKTGLRLEVVENAPRLHDTKINEKILDKMARLLSFRLMTLYEKA